MDKGGSRSTSIHVLLRRMYKAIRQFEPGKGEDIITPQCGGVSDVLARTTHHFQNTPRWAKILYRSLFHLINYCTQEAARLQGRNVFGFASQSFVFLSSTPTQYYVEMHVGQNWARRWKEWLDSKLKLHGYCCLHQRYQVFSKPISLVVLHSPQQLTQYFNSYSVHVGHL